jgi:hypothetical protein
MNISMVVQIMSNVRDDIYQWCLSQILKQTIHYLLSVLQWHCIENYVGRWSYNIKEYSQAIIKHYFRLLVLENTLSFTKNSIAYWRLFSTLLYLYVKKKNCILKTWREREMRSFSWHSVSYWSQSNFIFFFSLFSSLFSLFFSFSFDPLIRMMMWQHHFSLVIPSSIVNIMHIQFNQSESQLDWNSWFMLLFFFLSLSEESIQKIVSEYSIYLVSI